MTYRGLNVLDLRPNFRGLTLAQADDFSYESAGLGLATPWKATDRPRRILTLDFLLDGAAEIQTMLEFWQDRGGQRQAVWVPTYAGDWRLAANASAGATSITVQASQFAERFALGNQFKHVCLLTWTKMEFYGVTGVTPSGSTEVLALDRALDTDLLAGETACCPAMVCRLADPEVKYEYESEDVAKASVKLLELPLETPPPLPGTLAENVGSKPIWLYRVTRRSIYYRFANYGVPIVDGGGNTWGPANITHDRISNGLEMLGDELTLEVVTDDTASVWREFRDRLQLFETTVDVYLTDADTLTVDETEPLHSGRVQSADFDEKGKIRIRLSSLFRIGDRKVPRVLISRLCHHRTFDANCGLVESTWTTAGTVASLGGGPPAFVSASAFGAKATLEGDLDWFALGKVTCGTEVRLCTGVNHSVPDILYLNAPFRDASVGDAVSAVAGDNKRVSTCQGKFNNLANFVGFPYIPSKNPQYEALTVPQQGGGKK